MVFSNNLLMGAAGQSTGYTIDQSIRFNDDDSAYLEKTFASAGDRQIWTWSAWIKLSGSTARQIIFGAAGGPSYISINENATGSAFFNLYNAGWYWETAAKYRDPSGWYHLVWAFDTTNATADNRMRFYVNGSEVTDYSTKHATGSQNASGDINNNVVHRIGRHPASTNYYDGYLAEINFIDGQQLDPSSFGETNADTGQWVPIKYTGSYGTNGFYITGSNSADLGADESGNNNDFTSSGLTAADQMVDTPTNNFCTLNTIEPVWGAKPTISNGNLDIAGASATVWNNAVATFKTLPSTGKWIWAAEPNTSGGGQCDPWIVNETGLASRNNYVYVDANGWETTFDSASVHTVLNNGASRNASFTYGSGDFHVICFDADSKKLWFGIYDVSAGTLQFHDGSTGLTGDPGAGTNPTYTLTGNEFSIGFATFTGRGGNVDFGQSDLLSQFTAPTDFKTLCTANLDDPTIALPKKYFNTVLYEGNGGGQRVGQFQPITETYTVPNSVIFNDNDSAYLTRTPASDGNRQTMTFSWWMKRGNLNITDCRIFTALDTSDDQIRFRDASDYNRLDVFFDGTAGGRLTTSRAFDDSSMWNHCVVAIDTTQSTAADRVKIYINGVRVTEFDTETQPSLNKNLNGFNNNGVHAIGARGWSGAAGFYDGYLAEIYFIDGQQLDASSFGQLDASTNKWIPKDASGLTFGTNGYYLDMETAPATGSGAGTDSSGNGNNFTESGFAAADQVTDSPTDNFTTLNPLINSGVTLSSGNLTFTGGSGDDAVPATIPLKTGKWYWEMELVSWSSSASVVFGGGIVDMDAPYSEMQAHYAGYAAALPGLQYPYSNPSRTIAWDKAGNDVSVTGLGTCANGDIIQFAMDLDNGALYIGRNNTWLNSGDPESGSSRTGSVFPVTPNVNGWAPVANSRGSSYELQFNFGQSGGFTYTPPTGFSAISSDSLPLSNGDLSAFVWIKNRDAADNHMLFDAVRGVTKDVHSNATSLEATNANTLTRFLKNGFEVGNDAEVNTSGESYVAWQWLDDSLTTSSNSDGDITSTVLANTTAGFSIVTATPSLTGTENIGHGIGIAPKMILGKNLDLADNWYVYHDAISPAQSISLNTTGAPTTTRYNAATTSSVFQIVNAAWTNGGQRCLWYCFAEIEGFSKIGSYTGNGSTDGAFVYTGFKPAFVLWKQYTNLGTNSWGIRDAARDPSNVVESVLRPDTTGTETTASSAYADFLSNGFKLRATDGFVNKASSNYLYMAFAESPFKTTTAR